MDDPSRGLGKNVAGALVGENFRELEIEYRERKSTICIRRPISIALAP